MTLPTEPIGSVPRPQALIDGMQAAAAGRISAEQLDALYDDAVRDTLRRCEETGSPVITDGEQRKPLRSEQQHWQAPRQAIGPAYAPAPSGWQESYQQQGSMIYGPEGAGYHSFGHPSGTGATYERYGTMLYGRDRRCHLSGNTALCW